MPLSRAGRGLTVMAITIGVMPMLRTPISVVVLDLPTDPFGMLIGRGSAKSSIDFLVNQFANFARRSRNNHSEFIAPPRMSFMRELRPRLRLFSN